jgi:hypothetical protein
LNASPERPRAARTSALHSGAGGGPDDAALAIVTADFVIDDTYITFRYARNLANGYGLVWNPGGEATQGYTNQLLVWLLAAGSRLGLPFLPLSHWLNAIGLGAILASV